MVPYDSSVRGRRGQGRRCCLHRHRWSEGEKALVARGFGQGCRLRGWRHGQHRDEGDREVGEKTEMQSSPDPLADLQNRVQTLERQVEALLARERE